MSARPKLPASCRDLDLAKVKRALVASRCSVAAAARKLRVPSVDLRKLVWLMPELDAAAAEVLEQQIDEAQRVLIEGLKHPDPTQRLKAASTLLTISPAGRKRGFGRGAVLVERLAAPATFAWEKADDA